MRPARLAEAADLVVALRLQAARQATGKDRDLRDADPERLGHDAEGLARANHLHDVILGGPFALGAAAGRRLLAGERDIRRIAQQPGAQRA